MSKAFPKPAPRKCWMSGRGPDCRLADRPGPADLQENPGAASQISDPSDGPGAHDFYSCIHEKRMEFYQKLGDCIVKENNGALLKEFKVYGENKSEMGRISNETPGKGMVNHPGTWGSVVSPDAPNWGIWQTPFTSKLSTAWPPYAFFLNVKSKTTCFQNLGIDWKKCYCQTKKCETCYSFDRDVGGFDVNETGIALSITKKAENIIPPVARPVKNTHSEYGEPIPLTFGTVKLPGQVIEVRNRVDHLGRYVYEDSEADTKVIQTKTRAYTTADMYFSICEGPTKLLRLWIENVLVYDATFRTDTYEARGLKQALDGLNKTNVGVDLFFPEKASLEWVDGSRGEKPRGGSDIAYRGQSYLILKNFVFASGIPKILAEVTTEQEAKEAIAEDFEGQPLYVTAAHQTTIYVMSDRFKVITSNGDLVEMLYSTLGVTALNSSNAPTVGFTEDGHVHWLASTGTSTFFWNLGSRRVFESTKHTNYNQLVDGVVRIDSQTSMNLHATSFGSTVTLYVTALDADLVVRAGTISVPNTISRMYIDEVNDGEINATYLLVFFGNKVRRYLLSGAEAETQEVTYFLLTGILYTEQTVPVLSISNIHKSSNGNLRVSGNGGAYILLGQKAATQFNYDNLNPDIPTATPLDLIYKTSTSVPRVVIAHDYDETIWFSGYTRYSLGTTLTSIVTENDYTLPGGTFVLDGQRAILSSVVSSVNTIVFLDYFTRSNVTLATVVEALIRRASPEHVGSYESFEPYTMIGYEIAEITDYRSVFDQLSSFFNVSLTTDLVMRPVVNETATPTTVSFDKGANNTFFTRKQNEVQDLIYNKITIDYYNAVKRDGVQSVFVNVDNNPYGEFESTATTGETMAISAPIYVTEQQAYEAAYRAMNRALGSANTAKMGVDHRFIALTAGDHILVDTGETYQITSETFRLRFGTELELTQVESGTIAFNYDETEADDDEIIVRDPQTEPYFINTIAVPEQARSRMSFMVAGGTDGVTVTFEDQSYVLNKAMRGRLITTLGKPRSFDERQQTDYLEVTFEDDVTATAVMTLATATLADIMISFEANTLIVGKEIVQFDTASLITSDTIRFTGLWRGRRGSYFIQSSHEIDETVFYYTPDTIASFNKQYPSQRGGYTSLLINSRPIVARLETNSYLPGIGLRFDDDYSGGSPGIGPRVISTIATRDWNVGLGYTSQVQAATFGDENTNSMLQLFPPDSLKDGTNHSIFILRAPFDPDLFKAAYLSYLNDPIPDGSPLVQVQKVYFPDSPYFFARMIRNFSNSSFDPLWNLDFLVYTDYVILSTDFTTTLPYDSILEYGNFSMVKDYRGQKNFHFDTDPNYYKYPTTA